MMAEILPRPGNGMLPTHLSTQKIPVEREIREHRNTPSRLAGLEAVLVQIGSADFGVDIAPREYRLHAAADRGLVLPVKTLSVMKHGGFEIRNQSGAAESLGDDSLRDIAKTDDVALLDRRQSSNFHPGRAGEAARFLRHRLPAEPVLGVEREPAAVDAFEAFLVRVGRAHANHSLAEELVHFHAHFGLDLVVPLVALGIQDEAKTDKRSYGDRPRVGGK